MTVIMTAQALAFALSGVFSASIRLEAAEMALQKKGNIMGAFAVGKNPVVDQLMRLRYNPFFSYMERRIIESI